MAAELGQQLGLALADNVQGVAQVENGEAMKPNVVRDRELLTGQNPFSDEPFVGELLDMLGGARA